MNNTDGDKYTDIPNNIHNQNSTTNSIHLPINTISENVHPSDIRKKQSEKNCKL